MGTVSNALKILDHFPLDAAGIGLTELSRATGQNKATVYRYLCELESNSFVEQDQETRKYRVGPALTRLAQGRKRRAGAREIITPIVGTLSAAMKGWAVLFDVAEATVAPVALFHGGDARDPGQHVAFARLPLDSSSTGIVCFAFGQQFDTPTAHREIVETCRAEGLAHTPGVRADALQSISAPIFGSTGDLAFVATLVLPATDDRQLNAQTHEATLTLAATAATMAIGGRTKQFHTYRRAQ
ncbi:helix-turn-helix domain-containing protein [Phaeobacter sp. JH20_10]|uniref:helix-turn-helix domain-containing protein n=1 Tax=unclassified Phaeobacter TaxID=2621772 RepID=UPI003A89449A